MRNVSGGYDRPFGARFRVAFYLSVFALLALISFSSPVEAQDVNEDSSINNSNNTDTSVEVQGQSCGTIIDQVNNSNAGDADAMGDDAVAEVAAATDSSVSIVKSCIQAGGDIVLAQSNNSGNGAAGDQYDDGDDSGTVNAARDDSDSCALKLDPKVSVSDRGDDTATLNVDSDQTGNYRVAYDVEDNASINISLTSTNSSDAIGGFAVQGNGSRIVELTEGNYTINIEPTPAEAEYTVEVSRCGSSSSDPDDVLGNTYEVTKVLVNTGGPTEVSQLNSTSAVLIPSGALLLVSGLVIGLWLRRQHG